jgi:large subunit ribosomal protein L22
MKRKIEGFSAVHRFIPVSPQKSKLVIDLVRGKNVNEALNTLRYTAKRAAYYVDHLIRSAVANAQSSEKAGDVDVDNLYVAEIRSDKGPYLRRFHSRAMGRGVRIMKKTCHISVILRQAEETAAE